MNEALRHALEVRGVDVQALEPTTDLVQSGLLDSLEFVGMILELEQATGRTIDLVQLGDGLTLVGALGDALDGA